jgi:ribosomal protein L40E
LIDNRLIILGSVLIWFFIVLPVLVISPIVAGVIWLVDIFILVWGYYGLKNQKQTKDREILRRAYIEEQAKERAGQESQFQETNRLPGWQSYPNQPYQYQPYPTQQTVKETIITREVLIQCRNCGARYPHGTLRCLTCGANL